MVMVWYWYGIGIVLVWYWIGIGMAFYGFGCMVWYVV